MNVIRRPRQTDCRAFTLVELLTVIGLIVLIAALAVPNFSAMMREQRWNSSISAIQAAIMRAKAYAVNNELDHAVEFCTDTDGTTYLRIEAESAYLESIPNLKQLLDITDSVIAIPLGWYHAFVARRDAWGSDGIRLRSGIWDCYWTRSPMGWGHLQPCYSNYWGHSTSCKPAYDDRYPFAKSNLYQPWHPRGGSDLVSVDENTNVAGDHGYRDVNDDYNYMYQSTEHAAAIRDNLAVDDYLYLPEGIMLILVGADSSTLTNYDAGVNAAGNDVANHGWDGTPDLRFGKGGHLLQPQSVEIALTRKDGAIMRVQLLRGVGRLRKIQ